MMNETGLLLYLQGFQQDKLALHSSFFEGISIAVLSLQAAKQ